MAARSNSFIFGRLRTHRKKASAVTQKPVAIPPVAISLQSEGQELVGANGFEPLTPAV